MWTALSNKPSRSIISEIRHRSGARGRMTRVGETVAQEERSVGLQACPDRRADEYAAEGLVPEVTAFTNVTMSGVTP